MTVRAAMDWGSPYYEYKIPRRKGKINVTRSIPPFKVEIDGLSDVLAQFRDRDLKKICDFGAGRLRNSLYLLRKQFKVWAVEFKEAEETDFGKKMYAKARKYDDFFVLKYPDQFLGFDHKFDAILLINVCHIVPKESERKRILRECRDRLKDSGLLLWMSQHGEPYYKPGAAKRLKVEDGWIYYLHQEYQSFFREYKIPDILDLVSSVGFRKIEKITSRNHYAFLFEKTGDA